MLTLKAKGKSIDKTPQSRLKLTTRNSFDEQDPKLFGKKIIGTTSAKHIKSISYSKILGFNQPMLSLDYKHDPIEIVRETLLEQNEDQQQGYQTVDLVSVVESTRNKFLSTCNLSVQNTDRYSHGLIHSQQISPRILMP